MERQLFVFVILHYVHAEIEEGNEEEYYHYVGHGVTHNGSHPNATNQTKEAADGGDNPNDSTELIHGKRVFESKVKGQRLKVEGRGSKVEGRGSKVEGRGSKVKGRRSIRPDGKL